MKRYAFTILFWGSLWGIAEASLGNLIHLAAIALPGLPGFLMFPIAFYFMKKVFDATGQVWSIFHIAVVAASIKMIDFLLPVYIPIRIINPALCILLEGLAVAGVYMLYRSWGRRLTYPAALTMGVAWRTVFLLYLGVISLFGLPAALVTDGIAVSLRFVLLESFVNSILIYACLQSARVRPRWAVRSRLEIRPAWAGGVFILALTTQILL